MRNQKREVKEESEKMSERPSVVLFSLCLRLDLKKTSIRRGCWSDRFLRSAGLRAGSFSFASHWGLAEKTARYFLHRLRLRMRQPAS
jgi:hypothetical protein